MILKDKAQAATELAILGALIIVAFSFLINYSEKINRQQASIQQAFRAALFEAKSANNSVSYSKKTFLRLPNVGSPKELGQLESFSDKAMILWKDGKDRDDVYAYTKNPTNGNMEWNLIGRYERKGLSKYQFNDATKYILRNEETGTVSLVDSKPQAQTIYEMRNGTLYIKSPEYKPQGTKVTTDSFVNVADATTKLTQSAPLNGEVTTTKSLHVTDTLTANVNVEGTDQPTFTHTLGAGGKYSSTGGGIDR